MNPVRNQQFELACDLDESSYIVPAMKFRNSYLDLGEMDIDDSSDDDLSPNQVEREGNEIHYSRDRIERLEELFDNQFHYKNILDESICRHCGNQAIKHADKIAKSNQKLFQALSLQAHRLQSKQSLSSSAERDSSTSSYSNAELNTLIQTMKSLEDEISQINDLTEESREEEIELSAAIDEDHHMINMLDHEATNLENDIRLNLSLTEQSFQELGYLSSLHTIHMKPLFNISVAHHPMPASKSSLSSLQHMTPQLHRIFAVNGLRLYLEPMNEYNLPWNEINAAWSCMATLIQCLRNGVGFDNDIRNHHDHKKAFSNRDHKSVYGIRIVGLRSRALVSLLGGLDANSHSHVIQSLPMEGYKPSSKTKASSDIMSSSYKIYRRSVLCMCLSVAFTIAELYRSPSHLEEPLLSLYTAALDGKIDFALEEDDEWDDSIPGGGLVIDNHEGSMSSSYHFSDFEGLSSNQLHSLVNAAIISLIDLI